MLRELTFCHWARRLLSPYLDEELGSSSRRWVERHLGLCEDCRRRLESLRGSLEALRSLPALEPSASWSISITRQTTPEPASLSGRVRARLGSAFEGIEPAWVVTAVVCVLTTLAISAWCFLAPGPGLPPSAIAAQQNITEEVE